MTDTTDNTGEKVVLQRAVWICVALFAVRITPWMASEFWYDEVVTLGDFAIGRPGWPLAGVFRYYPVANNHILMSALMWCWVRLFQFNLNEVLMRLPAAMFGGLTIWWVVRCWSRDLGARVAFIAGLTLAISPVFGAFACQIRGYAPTLFLVTVLTTGALELIGGRRQAALPKVLATGFLLPLIIPSNVVVVGALALFVLICPGAARPRSRRVQDMLWISVPGTLGVCYYLTILDQFLKVVRQTAGWESVWPVVGNVLLGAALHLGIAAVVFALVLWRFWRVSESRATAAHIRRALSLLGACAVAAFALALVGERAPFPRVFLMFLPPVTYGVFLAVHEHAFWTRARLLVIAGLTVMCGFFWTRLADWRTTEQLREGLAPQDLLQQYYRGRDELKELAGVYRKAPLFEDCIILTSAHDFPTFRFYRVQRTGGRGATVAESRISDELGPLRARNPSAALLVVALNETEAARIFGAAGYTGRFELLISSEGVRGLYGPAGGMPGGSGAPRPSKEAPSTGPRAPTAADSRV
ncbi:MAG: hypothetical protein KAI66_19970 [Lentisphaeria bacterium]|nr:hypothetical protein [Lentisphaeria bacterium]